MRGSQGGGQIRAVQTRTTNPTDVLLPPGYKIELVAKDFTFPTAVTFDDAGNLYVLESGYCYGEVFTDPQLLKIENNGVRTVIAKGERNGPWNGVVFHEGNFYVSEGGAIEGGKILRITPGGEITVLVDNLPSLGDHHTNTLLVREGFIYFGQGTATNSAVVGVDNAAFGWLKRKPEFHDIPCGDIVLTGENFDTEQPLTKNEDDKSTTGAFTAFGTKTSPGQTIKGSVPCTGSIMRIPVNGGRVEVVAWGLRNPFGLAVAPDGKLYTTENAYDERGSRPVWGTGDVLWEVKDNNTWYGWPDFSAGKPIRADEEFKPPSNKKVKPLLKEYPNTPPEPVAIFGVHSSANGFDFSDSADFGFTGEAFVALFGDMAPGVGKVLSPVGFKIVRVDVKSGVIRDFAVNKGKKNGPASWLKHGGLERPVSVSFGPSGEDLFVVDFGILQMNGSRARPQQNTGVIWKIVKQ
jgi:glucose/arabinose dehydrogenase